MDKTKNGNFEELAGFIGVLAGIDYESQGAGAGGKTTREFQAA